MDFKTLFEEACKVDPEDAISVEVHAWRHHDGSTALEWLIYSRNQGKYFSAQSPETVLRMYRDKVVDEPFEAGLSKVGLPKI